MEFLERIGLNRGIKYAKMSECKITPGSDHPIGLSFAIAANAFFVLNSGLSHYAQSSEDAKSP